MGINDPTSRLGLKRSQYIQMYLLSDKNADSSRKNEEKTTKGTIQRFEAISLLHLDLNVLAVDGLRRNAKGI